MTARGSLQGVGCGSPKRGVVVGWGWGLMKENSQQVTPSLYLGVLSQRLPSPSQLVSCPHGPLSSAQTLHEPP